jgi:hypothetical protein
MSQQTKSTQSNQSLLCFITSPPYSPFFYHHCALSRSRWHLHLKYDTAALEAMLKSLGRMKTVFEHGEGGCATDGYALEAMPKSPVSGNTCSPEAMPK